jgi:hypothetical protein
MSQIIKHLHPEVIRKTAASFKPFVIAAMIYLARVKSPLAALGKLGLLRKNGHRSKTVHGLIVLVFEVNGAEII